MQQHLFKLDEYEFSLPFMGQDIQETPVPILLRVCCCMCLHANCQICKTHITRILSILKKLVPADLQREAVH
jgi:hypothetical protein